MGWLFLYAGLVKILDPNWTALGYLQGSEILSSLYQWLALPSNIGWVNLLNEWGLTLIGISLVVGLFVRLSSMSGALLMILYYLPALDFPYVGDHSFVVDDHIIYVLVLILLWAFDAGVYGGMDKLVRERDGDHGIESHAKDIDY